VGGSGDAEVFEVCVGAPAEALEQADEEFGVADVAGAFLGAHVEPDAEVWPLAGADGLDAVQEAAVIPPE